MRSVNNALRFVVSLLLCVCAGVMILAAQEATGRIVGTIYDQSGAVVSGAHVVATNVAHLSRQSVGRNPDLQRA